MGGSLPTFTKGWSGLSLALDCLHWLKSTIVRRNRTVSLFDELRQRVSVPNAARERAATVFRALGDPERLRIIELLAVDECCVSELAEVAGIHPNTLTQRLRVLRTSGLVERRRSGRQIFYRLADGSVADFVRRTFGHAIENSVPHQGRTAKI